MKKKLLTILLSAFMIVTAFTTNASAETTVAKIDDQSYKTLAAAIENAKTGEQVDIVLAGIYNIPNIPNNITIKATVSGVVFNCEGSGSIASIPNGVTFDNVKMIFGNSSYHGFQHAGSIKMKNCTLNGLFFSYGNMQFDNCTFEQETGEYNMWAYGNDLTFNDCTFNSQGKFINVYCESNSETYNIVCNRCTFNSSKVNKSALNVKETCGATLLKYNVELNDCTTNDNFPTDKVGGSKLWMVDDLSATGETDLTVKVDKKQVYPFVQNETNGEGYSTLKAAVLAAENNQTIVLLDDIVDGSGIFVKDKNIIIDLNNKNYTVSKELVGSNGTVNQAFHFEKGATVTLKNGAIFVSDKNAKFIIQNYADLTLENVVIEQEFENQNNVKYCISNNSGEVNIIGNTAIIASENVTAIECSWWPSAYADGAQVNINTTGAIEGDIELGMYGIGTSIERDNKSKITLNNAKFDGQIIKTTSATGKYGTGLTPNEEKQAFASMFEIKGGVFANTSVKDYLDNGEALIANDDPVTNKYFPYMIGEEKVDANTNSNQVENREPKVSEEITSVEEKTFAENIAEIVKKTEIDLRQEAADMANNPEIVTNEMIEKAQSTEILEELGISDVEKDEKLEIVVETALDQEVRNVNIDQTGSIQNYAVDITPVYVVKAVNKDTGASKDLTSGTNVAKVERDITIKIYLPEDFAEKDDRLYIKHKGKVYGLDTDELNGKIYVKEDESGLFVEFINPDGFSVFELSKDEIKPDPEVTPTPTPDPDTKPRYKVPNTGVDGMYSNNYSLLKLSSLSLLALGAYMVIKKKKDN